MAVFDRPTTCNWPPTPRHKSSPVSMVSTSGGDQGKMAPMVHQHEERYGEAPKEVLVDGGFAKKENIEEVSPPHGTTTVYTPVQKSKDPERDPHTPRADDAPAV